jgi:hypothetical protein
MFSKNKKTMVILRMRSLIIFMRAEFIGKKIERVNASIEVNSKEDWVPLPKEQTAVTWKELIKKLEQNQHELVESLTKLNDADLDKDLANTSNSLRTFLEWTNTT